MNIPNKLPTQKGDPLQIERLTNAINDILDYLQAKENKSYKAASSVCCDSSFRLEGDTKEGTMFHVCNNCNKSCDIKLKEKKVEASKGECICEDKNNPHTHLVVCPVHGILNHYSNSNPPEHEEDEDEVEKIINPFLEKWLPDSYPHLVDTDENDGQRLRNKIRDNFVSKEKIKRELEHLDPDWTDAKDLLNRILGD